jgi:hypothetical protein
MLTDRSAFAVETEWVRSSGGPSLVVRPAIRWSVARGDVQLAPMVAVPWSSEGASVVIAVGVERVLWRRASR